MGFFALTGITGTQRGHEQKALGLWLKNTGALFGEYFGHHKLLTEFFITHYVTTCSLGEHLVKSFCMVNFNNLKRDYENQFERVALSEKTQNQRTCTDIFIKIFLLLQVSPIIIYFVIQSSF